MSVTYNNQIEIALYDKVDRKTEKYPNEFGYVTFPDGTKYEVSIWHRVSKNGTPYRSGVLKLQDPKYAKPAATGQAAVDF